MLKHLTQKFGKRYIFLAVMRSSSRRFQNFAECVTSFATDCRFVLLLRIRYSHAGHVKCRVNWSPASKLCSTVRIDHFALSKLCSAVEFGIAVTLVDHRKYDTLYLEGAAAVDRVRNSASEASISISSSVLRPLLALSGLFFIDPSALSLCIFHLFHVRNYLEREVTVRT